MNLFGKPKERRTQLHFRDDGRFEFRKLEIEDTFLCEKKDKVVVRGWKHFYKNQFPFGGYAGIGADLVTLSYDRDIILDPYNLISDKEKPDKYAEYLNATEKGNKKQPGILPWLVEVGNACRLKILSKRAKSANYDRIVLFLGIALMLELLLIGVIIARN